MPVRTWLVWKGQLGPFQWQQLASSCFCVAGIAW